MFKNFFLEQGAAGIAIKSDIAAQSNNLPYPPEELRITNDDDIYLEGWFLT